MKNWKINGIKALLASVTLFAVAESIAQTLPPGNPTPLPPTVPAITVTPMLPPPFSQTFPVGVLTINCTVYTSTFDSGRNSFHRGNYIYNTKNLLSDLATDLGVIFPTGSRLEVFTTPYDIGDGNFAIWSSGSSVVVTNNNGQSWDVSKYVQVGLVSTDSAAMIQGTVGTSYNSTQNVSALFLGGFHFEDANKTIDFKGVTSFATKVSAHPAGSQNNLLVNTTLLMKSGAGSQTFPGAGTSSALTVGQMLVTGRTIWIINP